VSQSLGNLADTLVKRERDIASQWLAIQAAEDKRSSAGEQQEVARKSRELLESITAAARTEKLDNLAAPGWARTGDLLKDFSASRAKGGYTPSETAAFVFSLKKPIFAVLREECGSDGELLATGIWQTTELIDQLGLITMDAYQVTREEVISRQQQELLELSTPVVRLWENILALPLIGTLDSARTQIVMQNLLEAIVTTRSDFAIIDITGVPVVDTLVAQHLLKTVAAARLMGADCLISGIRPQIAQTIIHLGVDLTNVTTNATLADAFAIALRRSGHTVTTHEQARNYEAVKATAPR
jgi:rsbT co-antagonist protein RsbR